MFVDSHAHIDGPEYDTDRDQVIARAREAGVQKILNVGTGDPQSGAFERAVLLAESQEHIYAAVGVHPHDAKLYDDASETRIKDLIKESSRVIAWGEIGLDFHYDNSPRDVQCEAFRRQLRLARNANLPVIIHTREAEEETIAILRSDWVGANRQGVMHCFTGSARLARQCIELGFSISFSGILTFKNATDLRTIAAEVPLERLLIETDCPYLAPIPFRGKRNEPAYVVEVARCLSQVRKIEVQDLARITTANFSRLFMKSEP